MRCELPASDGNDKGLDVVLGGDGEWGVAVGVMGGVWDAVVQLL